jgi:hypothetical protein
MKNFHPVVMFPSAGIRWDERQPSIIRLFHQGAPKYTRIGFMDATRMRATAQTMYARYSLLLDLRHL